MRPATAWACWSSRPRNRSSCGAACGPPRAGARGAAGAHGVRKFARSSPGSRSRRPRSFLAVQLSFLARSGGGGTTIRAHRLHAGAHGAVARARP
jgi:hypothetical protein